MEPDAIARLIRQQLPDAQVHCEDLTGTRDHWRVTVTSEAFRGQPLLAQHRLVKAALHEKMLDNTIHALSLKTSPP
jgi:stress-induced morphogen